MRKLLVLLLAALLLTWLCPAEAAEEAVITAEAQGTYTQSAGTQEITLRLSVSGLNTPYCVFGIDEGMTIPEGFAIKSFLTSNAAQPLDPLMDYNTDFGILNYMSASLEDTIPGDTWYEVVLIAPEKASGSFTVEFLSVTISNVYGSNTLVHAEKITVEFTIDTDSTSYTVGSLAVHSATGESLSAIPAKDFLVTVPVTKTAGEGDCLVFLAAYGASGQFRGLMYVQLEDVPEGATVKVTLPVENAGGGIASLKAFSVASFGNLTPLGEAAAFPIGD